MCSADIFLGFLAILFPPLPGTSSSPYNHPSTTTQQRYLRIRQSSAPALSHHLGTTSLASQPIGEGIVGCGFEAPNVWGERMRSRC